MRSLFRTAAAIAFGLTILAVLAGPASASQPAIHFVEDVTGDQFVCTSTTYTITSGTIKTTIHEGQSATGNQNFTGTVTPQNVVAEDTAGNEVTLRGAFWFGGTFNTQRGTEQFWATGKLQFLDATGTVNSVNTTFFIQIVDGEITNIKDFNFGTCSPPEDE